MKEDRMNNKCVFCGNIHFSKKKVQYLYRNNGDFIIINDVPAVVCDYCGEQYFEGRDIENIENLYQEFKIDKNKIIRKLEIPVEEYSALAY